MSSVASESLRAAPRPGEDWRGQHHAPALVGNHLPSWGMLVTGAVLLGLGFMAWRTFGPDLRRYLKIESM